MQHRVRSDAELLELARRGSDSAFAVLVHRHAPRVIRAADGRDPVDHAVSVFATAMRRLEHAPDDVGSWLDALADSQDRSPAPDGTVGDSGDPTIEIARDPSPDADMAAMIDVVWARLAPRWPSGRRRVRVPAAVTWVITIVVTVVVGAAVPWLVLGSFPHEVDIQVLRAFPIDDGPPPDPEPSVEQPLPTFEFPVPPEELLIEPEDPFDELDDDEDDNGDDDNGDDDNGDDDNGDDDEIEDPDGAESEDNDGEPAADGADEES